MFVVMKIQDFEFEASPENRFTLPFPITVDKGKKVGYLPVYNTREDALSEYPNSELVEIREARRG